MGPKAALLRTVGAVFDLDHQSVEIDHRIQQLQRPPLPGQHLLSDLVGDLGNRLMGQLGADRGNQVVLNVAQRLIPPAYRLMITSSRGRRAGGLPRYQLQGEGAGAVAGAFSSTSPISPETVFRGWCRYVGVGDSRRVRIAAFTSHMIGQLHFHGPRSRAAFNIAFSKPSSPPSGFPPASICSKIPSRASEAFSQSANSRCRARRSALRALRHGHSSVLLSMGSPLLTQKNLTPPMAALTICSNAGGIRPGNPSNRPVIAGHPTRKPSGFQTGGLI